MCPASAGNLGCLNDQGASQSVTPVGMSAMPSMHVAMSFFGYPLARALAAPWPVRWFTLLFTATMLFASVRLGWHYLSDGLLSSSHDLVLDHVQYLSRPISNLVFDLSWLLLWQSIHQQSQQQFLDRSQLLYQ